MKRNLVITFLLFCLSADAQLKPSKTQNDLEALTTLFEGEFDNFQQVYKEREDKVAEVHEHIHSIFKRVQLPQIGRHVFYVLQYFDGDSTKIYRQRLYHFTENKKEAAVQLTIYSFPIDSPFYYAHVHPQKLKNMDVAGLSKTDGCEVFWKRTDAGFVGYMKKGACNFISKRSGQKIFITDSLLLTKDEIWIRDEAYDENGGYVFGHKGKIPHKLKRCRFYKGWIILQKAGFDDAYHQMRNLTWHDQGKRIRLLTEDGKATKYEVELATVVYGKDLEVLKIAVYEVGVSKAVSYAWASPGAQNIGMNIRWIQAGLTLQQ